MKAFIFPGQGSQKVGMGKEFFEKTELGKKTYKFADEVLNFKLSSLCFEGPEDLLTQTENAQPAILVYNYIADQLLKENNIEPDFVAGHSLGEFSAILSSEMLKFEDVLLIVRKRGELMASADPEGKGGMAAVIGLDSNKVKEICEEISKNNYVMPVNYNSPDQVVISGYKEAIDIAENKLKEAGAKRVTKLAVSGAFHSKLMEDASLKFADVLKNYTFKKPKYKIYSNVTANLQDETNIKELLVLQMKSPVLWIDIIKNMKSSGLEETIEVGNGNILTGLVKKIDPSITTKSWSELVKL